MDAQWDDLKIFLALGRSRSVLAAAAYLKVSGTTIRRRIAALERVIGARLFERTEGEIELSRAGLQLMPAVEQMEQASMSALEVLNGADRMAVGTVRIGAPDGIGTLCVAPRLARLQERLPHLSIDLVTLTRVADLQHREVDVAVTWDRPKRGRHRIRSIRPAVLRLYASPGYLQASAPIRDESDLRGHKFVGYFDYAGFGQSITSLISKLGADSAPKFASSNIMAQARAVAEGAGIALLPDYVAEPHLGLAPLLHDRIVIPIPLWLHIHADVASLARVRAVADEIGDMFGLSRT